MNVFDLLEDRAQATPKNIYLRTVTDTWSFQDVHQAALAVAATYQISCVRQGDQVALVAGRSFASVVAIFALLRLGATVIPLDVDEPRDRISSLLARIAPAFAVCDDIIPAGNVKVLPLTAKSDLAHRMSSPDLLGNETAFTFFTTGSTGQPKGIELSHKAVIAGQKWLQSVFNLRSDDRQLFRTTLGVTNLLREIIWPVVAGCEACLLPPGRHADVAAHIETVDRLKVTVVGMVPILIDAMIAQRAGQRSLSSLRHIISTSDQFLAEQHERFRSALPGASLHNIYGLTEALYIAHHACPPDAHYERAVPIGRGAELRPLILTEDLREAAPGEVGRLYVHGVGMMSRYWNNPELTESRFVSLGDVRLFDTGDLASRKEDGSINLTGRSEYLVKIGGQRADVQDIERLIRSFNGVADTAVLPYDIGNGVKRLSAWIVPRRDVLFGEAEIRRHLAADLPAFMVPTTIRFVPELPRTHNGKVDRAKLVAELEPTKAGAAFATTAVDPMMAIVAAVLNVSRLAPDKSIVEQGGDSISAFLISVRAHEIGFSVNPSDLIALPLARALEIAKPIVRRRHASEARQDGLHALADYGWQARDIDRLMTDLRETRL